MSKILLEEPVVSLRGFENDPSRVDLRSITAAAVEADRAEKEKAENAERLRGYQSMLDRVRREKDPEKALEILHDRLVPSSGVASTKAGEMVRAMMRLLYRDYNDGDKFFSGYGLETCAPSAAWLMDNGFEQEFSDILDNQPHYQEDDDAYTAKLGEIARAVTIRILTEPELLLQRNEEDSRDYDAWQIEDRQYRDEIEVSYPWQIEQLLEDGEITTRDISNYLENAVEYESECEGAEIYYTGDSYATIGNLTFGGMDRASEIVNNPQFWDELIEEHRDALEDDNEEDTEDLDESVKAPLTEGVRDYTNALLDLAQEFGVTGWAYDLISNLLLYMSEDEVKDFAVSNEYLSDDLTESHKRAVTEDLDPDRADKPAPLGPQMGQDSGIAALLNDLIRDEWEAIQGYNDMQNMVRAEQPGYADEFLRVIADINAEENVHVGQLQRLMEIVAPNAKEFNSGEKEAEEQIHDAAMAEAENNGGVSDEV